MQVECDCGWRGAVRTIRQIGGWDIAKRDAKEHEWAHANAAGWFDHTKGWITNPDHQQNH